MQKLIAVIAVVVSLFVSPVVQAEDRFNILPTVRANQVTIIGYSHVSLSPIPSTVVEISPELYRLGVRIFLVEVPRQYQKEIDMLAKGTSPPDVTSFYKRAYGYGFPGMILALERYGISVLARDLPFRGGPATDFDARNVNYFSTIQKIIRAHPEEKIVLLIGYTHCNPLVDGLDKIGISVNALDLR